MESSSLSSSSSSSSPISSSVYLPGCALKLSLSSHLFFVFSWNFFLKSATASSRVVGPFSALAPASPYRQSTFHTFIRGAIDVADSLETIGPRITWRNVRWPRRVLPPSESIWASGMLRQTDRQTDRLQCLWTHMHTCRYISISIDE